MSLRPRITRRLAVWLTVAGSAVMLTAMSSGAARAHGVRPHPRPHARVSVVGLRMGGARDVRATLTARHRAVAGWLKLTTVEHRVRIEWFGNPFSPSHRREVKVVHFTQTMTLSHVRFSLARDASATFMLALDRAGWGCLQSSGSHILKLTVSQRAAILATRSFTAS